MLPRALVGLEGGHPLPFGASISAHRSWHITFKLFPPTQKKVSYHKQSARQHSWSTVLFLSAYYQLFNSYLQSPSIQFFLLSGETCSLYKFTNDRIDTMKHYINFLEQMDC